MAKATEVNIEIEKCSNCGHDILIGDTRCSNCGRDVQSTSQRFRQQPAIVISLIFFVAGIFIMIAAISMSGVAQIGAFVIGIGLILSGSLYYALDLLYFSDTNKKRE